MQDVLDSLLLVLKYYPGAWVALIFVLGLLIGSFLNVVIHRLPIMLEREWRAEAESILHPPVPEEEPVAATDVSAETPSPENGHPLGLENGHPLGEIAAGEIGHPQSAERAPENGHPPSAEPPPAEPARPATQARYNLVVPRSACPNCGALITAAQNVPVISYLFLRGKCANCGTKISPRYPIVELLTGMFSAVVAWKFGVTWYTGTALLLTWALIALSAIDIDHEILPDDITLPLLWLGLLLSLAAPVPNIGLPVDMRSSILGAVAGYLSLWSVYHLYKLLTGREGMGYGDFKLLAALGAWMGWQMLPLIILLSSFAGAVVGGAMILFRGRDRDIPIPFGPYLAVAGWIALLWGQELSGMYLRVTGLE